MKESNNINIFIIFLSFLMIVLSITSIELPWQHLESTQKFFGIECGVILIDRELFDSGIYYAPGEKEEWFEINSNSITNAIMVCMGINILSLSIILINPFKRFFKFISDSHYLFIEKILIRSLSIMIVVFYGLSTTIGMLLSGNFCKHRVSGEMVDDGCYSLGFFSEQHIDDYSILSTTISSKPMKGWYLSIVLFILSIILPIVIFIRFKIISPKLVDLGFKHYLTKKSTTSSIDDAGSEVPNISSNESDNIATVEIEPLL
ncbi:hypothetical protein ACTA71_000555 [Dictyostelium dimigraforme]